MSHGVDAIGGVTAAIAGAEPAMSAKQTQKAFSMPFLYVYLIVNPSKPSVHKNNEFLQIAFIMAAEEHTNLPRE